MIHTASDSIHVEEIVLGEDGQPVAATQQRQHFQPTPAQVLSWLPRNATPEQQDSAIQANIKPSEITWSQQPDTLHLPGHSKGKSWRDVNMPKYYRESYFTGKPFFHPELFGGRLGVAGDPVPYGIARDNVITLLLLGCFVLALIAYAKSKGFILRQAKDFFRPPHNEKMTAISETSGELRFQFFLVLQSSLLLALTGQGGGIQRYGVGVLRPAQQRPMAEVVPLPACNGGRVSVPYSNAARLLRTVRTNDTRQHRHSARHIQIAGALQVISHLFQKRRPFSANFFVLLHT